MLASVKEHSRRREQQVPSPLVELCCLEKSLKDLRGCGSVSEGKCRQWGRAWRWARPGTALQTLLNSSVFSERNAS